MRLNMRRSFGLSKTFYDGDEKCQLLRLLINIERRYFEVDGVPIMGPDDEWKGIVLVFHDMTEIKNWSR